MSLQTKPKNLYLMILGTNICSYPVIVPHDELMSSWAHELMSSWAHELMSSWAQELMSQSTHELIHELIGSWADELISSWAHRTHSTQSSYKPPHRPLRDPKNLFLHFLSVHSATLRICYEIWSEGWEAASVLAAQRPAFKATRSVHSNLRSQQPAFTATSVR